MLRFSQTYSETPILSLRTGHRIGTTLQPIINPNNLKIEGWYALSETDRNDYILPAMEIRDIIPKGIVVNDYDALTPPEDLVRLKEVIALDFEIHGLQVETESGDKVGKVKDYAIDDSSFFIKKLYVTPPLFRGGFTQEQVIIDRESITEITDRRIIVRDPTEKARGRVASPASA